MECPEHFVTCETPDQDQQQSPSEAATSTAGQSSQKSTILDNSCQSTDHQNLPETINSQMSDSTTITLSSPSQTIDMDSGDEFSNGTNPKNFADKECQRLRDTSKKSNLLPQL